MEKQHNPKNCCKACGSTNTYGMSRVVGYYSIIENWNGSKLAELKARQQGNYKLQEEPQLIMVQNELLTTQKELQTA